MVVHVGGIMDCEWLERDLGKTHGCRVVVLGNSSPVSSGMHRCNSMYDMGLADQSVMYRRNHEYPTRDYGFPMDNGRFEAAGCVVRLFQVSLPKCSSSHNLYPP